MAERMSAISDAQSVSTGEGPGRAAGALGSGAEGSTGEARVPQGTFKDLAGSLGAFRKLRGEMMQVAKTSKDDMRGRKLLEGNMSVYQWFLMISTHSQRHILQIREIKAHAGYPKK